jgi:hypothetical protein
MANLTVSAQVSSYPLQQEQLISLRGERKHARRLQ